MKTRTVVERVGEWLGPVDWAYDFTKHDWTDGRGGVNPECSARGKKLLRQVADLLETNKVAVSVHGLSHTVAMVGMYDGWPFWEPTPTVAVQTWLGVETHPWYSIQSLKIVGTKDDPTGPGDGR